MFAPIELRIGAVAVSFALKRPSPVRNVWNVDPFLVSVGAAIELPVQQPLARVRSTCLQRGNAIDRIDRQGIAIHLILDGQLHRGVDIAALLVATYMQIIVIGAPVGQPMNEPWISMEVEDDGFVG